MDLSALEAARLIAQRRLTSESLTRSCLERIEEREPSVQAWEYLDPDLALAQARLADCSPIRGPLHGVPLAVKDVIDTADMPTAYGSRIYHNHRPASDATCVALARAAGAIILGKTVTTEFALGPGGKTRNPHNPAHTPGGSSSGSAAAVACGMAPWAFGTQTWGSVIRPASFCGAVGYKATYGKADVTGIKTLAGGLDTLGLIARRVADIALLASVVTCGRIAAETRPKPPRIGFLDTSPLGVPDPATQNLLSVTARRLSQGGVQIHEIPSPASMASWDEALGLVYRWEMVQAFAWERLHRRDEFQPATRQAFERCERSATPGSYEVGLARASEARVQCEGLFTNCDVLLVPAAVGEAPKGLEFTGDARFNGLWSMLHVPCLTLPMGRGPTGLPIGLQLVGRRGDDDRLLSAASFVEACLAGHPR